MKLTILLENCWTGYKQVGMKEKNGKQVPNCVPNNESMVKEARSLNKVHSDMDKILNAIQKELAAYKSTKGTDESKKHVENLKKLHKAKDVLELEIEKVVSGLYKDAELKIED